jgi:hypothetical protein
VGAISVRGSAAGSVNACYRLNADRQNLNARQENGKALDFSVLMLYIASKKSCDFMQSPYYKPQQQACFLFAVIN